MICNSVFGLFLTLAITPLLCSCMHVKRSSGDEACRETLAAESMNCNVSWPESNDYSTTAAFYTALNSYFDEVCPRDACIDPQINLYNCLDITEEEKQYRLDYVYNINCGKSGDDYCQTLLYREYNETYVTTNLYRSCNYTLFSSDELPCDSGCVNLVTDFIETMGCCSAPYLGNLTTCITDSSSVTVPNVCSYVGSASINTISIMTVLLIVMITTLLSI